MLRILVNAYAACPNMGSEPGMAWNWCVNLAKYCELFIVTESEFEDKVRSAVSSLPQGKNMHFYFVPIGGDDEKLSQKIRKRCWNQGDWRFYVSYAKWQEMALEKGMQIMKEVEIDIVHQLNMIGFREPGQMWRIKGVPYIWGPTNAKEAFPVNYLEGVNVKSKAFIKLKNAITKYQLKNSTKVHSAAKRASFVVAASTDSANSIRKYLDVEPVMINESGCDIVDFDVKHKEDNGFFDLLWVGRFIFTKQLNLALETLAEAKNDKLRLHIVGGSLEEEAPYKEMAEKLGVTNQCVWYEKVSHDKVQELMQQSDLFFFTSIAEGTPHVILEAFSNELPVLCFDTCGHGDCVNESVGIKVSLSNPRQSVKEFAESINYLYSHKDVLQRMQLACPERQKIMSWDNKAKQMVHLYEEAIKKNMRN